MPRSAAGGRERASGKESARGYAHSASSQARHVCRSISASLTAQCSERNSLRSCGPREGLRSDRLAVRSPQVVAPRAGALHRLAAPGGLSSGRALADSPHAPHRWAGTRRSAPDGYSAPTVTSAGIPNTHGPASNDSLEQTGRPAGVRRSRSCLGRPAAQAQALDTRRACWSFSRRVPCGGTHARSR
jgi:hypothetical protein